ncbi:MAG: nucleoside 2-deoxyribosyltransferase domain-containing protein [Bryobacteraceae bacterium]|nr:nucleoside 2-deoxyribosyltransferase domain-containing protein [Bryobacteraceae bacterium]
MENEVFLGGACGRTTWRREIAIPRLNAAGVSYYNPQLGVGEWTPACEPAEMKAKDEAEVLLFVIHESTRGVASVGEASYLIGLGRPLALAVRMIPEGADWLGSEERDDLNRGRIFVRSMAAAHGVPVFEHVEEGVEQAIAQVRSGRRVRAILSDIECGDLRFEAKPVNGGYHLRVLALGMEGRAWYLPSSADESDVVRAAFKAAVTWQEHETREMFRYQGVAVFGPHIDVRELLRIKHP